MKTLEIIAGDNKSDVLMADTPSDLLLTVRGLVAAGIDHDFSDLQWLLYYGSMERMAVETDPFFKALLERLGSKDKPEQEESTRPNVVPGKESSIKRMAAIDGVGGGFYRVSQLVQHRYILAPAQDLVGDHPELSLDYAVSFTGECMAEVMAGQGFEPEIIDYRAEPAFPAFRERAIANFFLEQTTSA